jgi:hypothetical protein
MRRGKFRRKHDRLPCRSERPLLVAAHAADHGEVRHGLDIIGLGVKHLLDLRPRRGVIAPLMSDQPQMVQADGMIRIVRKNLHIGFLRLGRTPRPETFKRAHQQLRVCSLRRLILVRERAFLAVVLACPRCGPAHRCLLPVRPSRKDRNLALRQAYRLWRGFQGVRQRPLFRGVGTVPLRGRQKGRVGLGRRISETARLSLAEPASRNFSFILLLARGRARPQTRPRHVLRYSRNRQHKLWREDAIFYGHYGSGALMFRWR